MFRVTPTHPDPVIGLSPNTETPKHKLSRLLPKPAIGFIEDNPTLKLLTVKHIVKVPSAGGKVQRQACMRLALSPKASKRIIDHAIATGKIHLKLPPTSFAATQPSPSLIPHGVDLALNDNNELTAYQEWVSPEKMRFPGMTVEMNVRVSEMYIVEEKKSLFKAFITKTAAFSATDPHADPGIKLGSYKHVGTVAAFDLDNYLLYRQLEKKPGTLARIKERFRRQDDVPSADASKRKLLVEAHGQEQSFDGELLEGAPHAMSLPEGVAISYGAPSGKLLMAMEPLERSAELRNVDDVKNSWPAYCTQRMLGTKHQIEFMGKNIVPDGPDVGYQRANASDLFFLGTGFEAAVGHGKARNQILSPLEDIQPESAVHRNDMRAWPNPAQRGVLTPDGMAFAALNEKDGPNIDILSVKPGRQGHTSDLLSRLKDIGILDQYDEIHLQVCRPNAKFDALVEAQGGQPPSYDPYTGYKIGWFVSKENLPRKSSPTVVEFDKAASRPIITHANPDHAENQLRPDSPRSSTLHSPSPSERTTGI